MSRNSGPLWPSGIQILQPSNKMLLQAASFGMDGNMAARLLKDYNEKLISGLGMMARRDVKSKDIVDLRPLFDLKGIPGWQAPDPKLDFQDRIYVVEDYYYCYIPCFEEGVYHVNSDRYIYWRMTGLDTANHKLAVYLQDFVYYAEGCGWQPGVYGNVSWKFGDPDAERQEAFTGHRKMACEYEAAPDAVSDYVKLYRLLDARSMPWSKQDRKAWENVVIANAREGCRIMSDRTGLDNLGSLAAIFMSYTVKTNRILSQHKAAGRSRPVSDREHEAYLAEKRSAHENGAPVQKERRIRTVGAISITSRERPKPGRRAMANYTKASWETRGHIRTLRSGKKIWVKKSVHKRKALADKNPDGQAPGSTPLTIRIMPQDQGGGGTT